MNILSYHLLLPYVRSFQQIPQIKNGHGNRHRWQSLDVG